MAQAAAYDYQVVNEDLDVACDIVQAIIVAHTHKNKQPTK